MRGTSTALKEQGQIVRTSRRETGKIRVMTPILYPASSPTTDSQTVITGYSHMTPAKFVIRKPVILLQRKKNC